MVALHQLRAQKLQVVKALKNASVAGLLVMPAGNTNLDKDQIQALIDAFAQDFQPHVSVPVLLVLALA